MFFKGKFFYSEKYQTPLSKLCFLLLVHFSLFFFFSFPLFGTSCNNWESRKSFFPQRFADLLDEQASGLSWNLNPRKVSWLRLSVWCCTWLWLRGFFSIGAGMGNPLVQRKKRWKVYGLQCGKSSCRAASLSPLLNSGLVLHCSSHQLWQLSWIAVDHLKCFPCQLSTESCWNGSLPCSAAHSLLAMPSWWLSPIPHFF